MMCINISTIFIFILTPLENYIMNIKRKKRLLVHLELIFKFFVQRFFLNEPRNLELGTLTLDDLKINCQNSQLGQSN